VPTAERAAGGLDPSVDYMPYAYLRDPRSRRYDRLLSAGARALHANHRAARCDVGWAAALAHLGDAEKARERVWYAQRGL